MTTGIKTKKDDSQRASAGPNLGGPTSNPLASGKIQINTAIEDDNLVCGARAWVARYLELNGGA